MLEELRNEGRGTVLVHPHMGPAQLPLCVLGHMGFRAQVGGGGVAHEMSTRRKACERSGTVSRKAFPQRSGTADT